MKTKQILLYVAIFMAALLAMLGIAYGVHSGIKASNLADIEWYDVNEKEFVIKTEKELYDLEVLSRYYDFAGQTVKLGADIVVNEGNAEDWHTEAPAKKWQPITDFAGTFDGQGHSISGLYGKSSSMSMGLFSETKEGCVLQDFKLLNSYFTNTTGSGLGSILGEGTGAIKRVYSDAIVYGEYESNGGIVGLSKWPLVMEECWFDGHVIGERRNNGGLVGWIDRKGDVTIDNCLNSGTIEFRGDGGSKTAGLVGAVSEMAYRTGVSKLKMTNSLNTGTIKVPEGVGSYTATGIGCIRKFGSVTLENTYGTVTLDSVVTESTVAFNDGALVGNITPRFAENIKGVGAYQWMDLDFDKYWAAIEGETPVLKYFAKDSLSLAGVEKIVDTSWYKKGQTEFTINNVAQFWGFAMLSSNTNFAGVTIKLNTDIVLNETDASTWAENAPEYKWFAINNFSGTFDGQGHTISGVYCYSNQKYWGLFKVVESSSQVRNFRLENSYFRAAYCVGAVAGMGGGNVANIYCDAIVEGAGEHTGGIMGALNRTGKIVNCWFDGEVYGGTNYTGGITSALMTPTGSIEHCLNTGTVYAGKGHSTGGVIGISNNKGTITDCLTTGKIDVTKNKKNAGAVVGNITKTATPDFISVYATSESYASSVGTGYPHSGAPIMLSPERLKGNNAYSNTTLDFTNYWAIQKNGYPVLKTFADTIPSLPNTKRPIMADTSWYDPDKTTFVINTVEQLYGLGLLTARDTFAGKTVKLGKDIKVNTGDASTWATNAPQNIWVPIYSFVGTFDGQGHTISGLYMSDSLWRVGLFGGLGEGGVIKNVKVTNSYLEGAYHIGAIAGYMEKSTISGVYSDAYTVARSGHLAGIVGTMSDGTVENAWFDGVAETTTSYAGGITSFTGSGVNIIKNCLNTGTVKGANQVGGIVGRSASDTKISYSIGAGSVTSGTSNVGSVVGHVLKGSKCDITEGVYAIRGSAKSVTAGGAPIGLAIEYSAEELAGNLAYQKTILDFNKSWGIVADSTPVLRAFGGTAPTNTSAERVTMPDTSWYDAKKSTYVLNDYADLYGMSILAGTTDFAGKTVKLGANITGKQGTIQDQWVPVGGFAGTFDGQGKTISGINHNSAGNWYVGLFGSTAKGAVIKNVSLKDSAFSGQYHIGSFVGMTGEGTVIQNVYSNVNITCASGHGGGIAGSLSETTLDTCWFDGTINSPSYTGGMTSNMGGNNVFKHCLNTGTITGKSSVAGLAGRVDGNLVVEDCLNTGKITGNSHAASLVGYIVKDREVTIKNSYGTRESASKAVATGSYSGTPMLYAEYFLEEYSGYVVTNLDFDNYWVAQKGELPQLRKFVDTNNAKVLNHKDAKIRIDTSWYNKNDNKFTIKTAGELYGLAYLVNTGNNFAGKSIVLGADISFNKKEDITNSPMYRWTTIGSTANHANQTATFAGTFDGKMHTISGLSSDTSNIWFVGLFGATKGATIKNVIVKDSYFAGTYYTAGIVGYAMDTTIDTVYSNATIKNANASSSGNSAGIAGGITGSVNNAWFDGSIETWGQFVGGIAGVSFNSEGNTFTNCLNTGAIKNNRASGNVYTGGILGGAQGPIIMSQSVSATDTAITSTSTGRCGSVIGGVEKDSVVNNVYTTSGTYSAAIGALVNGATVSSTPEVLPSIKGYNAYTYTSLDFGAYWTVIEKDVPQLTSFATGKKVELTSDKLFKLDTSWIDASADSDGNAAGTKENPYILLDRGDLYGFAELVNEGNTFEGKYVSLGANIEVNFDGKAADWANGEEADHSWVPIGVNGDKHFMGTFDGKNPLTNEIQSVSGLYMSADKIGGLFVDVDNATLKNFKLENSYFNCEEGSGAVAGWYCGGTFDTIYVASDVIVANEHSTKGIRNHAAGLIGLINEAGTTVNNCWFDGSLSGKTYIGGITSYINADGVTISNCLVTGEITATGNYVGGIAGDANKTITIDNTLVACKEAIVGVGTNIGAVTGRIGSNSTIANVYASTKTYSKGSGANLDANMLLVEKLNGWAGYKHTDLDFTNTWYPMKDAEPRLQAFVTKGYLDTTALLDWSKAEGTQEDPYVIGTEAELYSLAKLANAGDTFAGKYIQLSADIEITDGSMWTPIGIMSKSGTAADNKTAFQGTFDGAGHKITNMKVASNSKSIHGGKGWYLGFIGVAKDATVKNLEILGATVSGDYNAAILVGNAENLTVENVHVSGTVTMTNGQAGGIVGAANGLTAVNTWNEANVTVGSYGYVGGIVGVLNMPKSTLTACYNTGTITCGGNYAGGFIGLSTANLEISDSLSAGPVNAKTTTRSGLGIGCMNGTNAQFINLDEKTVVVVKNGSTLKQLGLNYGQQIVNKAGTTLGATTCMTAFDTNADISGAKGYTDTKLVFDRPETTDVVEGYWVTTDGIPQLGSFSSSDNSNMVGQFIVETDWANHPVKQTVGGVQVNTYTLTKPGELLGFASLVNGGKDFAGEIIYLGADIVFNDATKADAENWANGTGTSGIYTGWTSIGYRKSGSDYKRFAGTFDGQMHEIRGIYSVSSAANGLFAYTNEATLKNFSLTNSYIQGGEGTGGVVGWYASGTYQGIYSNAIVKAYSGSSKNHAGGFFGLVNGTNPTVSNCWFDGQVTGAKYVGGFTSYNTVAVTFTDCLSTGTVKSTITTNSNSNYSHAGGFVGYAYSSVTLVDCVNACSVTGYGYTGSTIGLLKSGATFNATDCYFVGTIAAIGGASGTIIADGVTITAPSSSGAAVNKNNPTTKISDASTVYGALAYEVMSGLSFERSDVTPATTGAWVIREGNIPALKHFVDVDDRL